MLLLVAVFSAAPMVSAQSPTSRVDGIASDDAVARRSGLSPRVAALFAAATPRYSAPPAAENGLTVRTADGPDQPANGIVRLPDFLVREAKLPTPEEVRSRKELERWAMDKYLGPESGFDRGMLNLFTLPQLWRKIPVLGQILPCPIPAVTNEERAMMHYYEDERLRKMKDLLDLAAMAKRDPGALGGENLKREVQKTFLRDSGYGR